MPAYQPTHPPHIYIHIYTHIFNRYKLRKHRKNDGEAYRRLELLRRDFKQVQDLLALVRKRCVFLFCYMVGYISTSTRPSSSYPTNHPTQTEQRASEAGAPEAAARGVLADHRRAVRPAAQAADPQGSAHGGAGRAQAQDPGMRFLKCVFDLFCLRWWYDGPTDRPNTTHT